MLERIYGLYADLEGYLINKLDSETTITDEQAMEHYFMANSPDEYAIYCFLRNLFEKKNV